MPERTSLKRINSRAETAAERNRQQRERAEFKERRLLDSASERLYYTQEVFAKSPPLQDYLKQTGRQLTLAKRTSLRYAETPWVPNVYFLRSRIALDQRGVIINHDLHALYSDGPFAGQHHVDTVLSPEIIEQLWKHGEARPLIKAFSKMKRTQIQRKITKGIK